MFNTDSWTSEVICQIETSLEIPPQTKEIIKDSYDTYDTFSSDSHMIHCHKRLRKISTSPTSPHTTEAWNQVILQEPHLEFNLEPSVSLFKMAVSLQTAPASAQLHLRKTTHTVRFLKSSCWGVLKTSMSSKRPNRNYDNFKFSPVFQLPITPHSTNKRWSRTLLNHVS